MLNRIRNIALFAVIFCWIFSASAYALENPITPNLDEANRARSLIEELCNQPSTISDDDAPLQIKTVNTPSLTTPGEWEISITGGTAPYDVSIWLLEENAYGTNGYKSETINESTFSYSYEFVIPGQYELIVNVKTADGDEKYTYISFDITDSTGDAMTVEKKVNTIVQSCLNAGCSTDFDKALWLHDYLINNAHYDISYSYYSADGVLIRGTGVCDSYRWAYHLLLDAVGIENKAVIGGNHAWIAAYIEDGWYHIDPTWDDPMTSYDEEDDNLSGHECHDYFGLTDTIMHTDHTFSDQGANVLSQNYAIHEGFIAASTVYEDCKNAIAESLIDTSNLNCAYIENVYSALLNDAYTFQCNISEGTWAFERGRGPAYLLAYVLSQEEYTLGTAQVQYTVSYEPENKAWRSSVRKITDTNTQVLTMPDSCITIEDEAFIAAPAKAINLNHVNTVGARSFADCPQLTQIYVSDETTAIATDAFEGCENFLFVFCSKGSYGQQFALDSGLVPVLLP